MCVSEVKDRSTYTAHVGKAMWISTVSEVMPHTDGPTQFITSNGEKKRRKAKRWMCVRKLSSRGWKA